MVIINTKIKKTRIFVILFFLFIFLLLNFNFVKADNSIDFGNYILYKANSDGKIVLTENNNFQDDFSIVDSYDDFEDNDISDWSLIQNNNNIYSVSNSNCKGSYCMEINTLDHQYTVAGNVNAYKELYSGAENLEGCYGAYVYFSGRLDSKGANWLVGATQDNPDKYLDKGISFQDDKNGGTTDKQLRVHYYSDSDAGNDYTETYQGDEGTAMPFYVLICKFNSNFTVYYNTPYTSNGLYVWSRSDTSYPFNNFGVGVDHHNSGYEYATQIWFDNAFYFRTSEVNIIEEGDTVEDGKYYLVKKPDNTKTYDVNTGEEQIVDLTDYNFYSSLDKIIAPSKLSGNHENNYVTFNQNYYDSNYLWINNKFDKSFVIGYDSLSYLNAVSNESLYNPFLIDKPITIDFYYNLMNDSNYFYENKYTNDNTDNTEKGSLLEFTSDAYYTYYLYLEDAGSYNNIAIYYDKKNDQNEGYIKCNDNIYKSVYNGSSGEYVRHRITLIIDSNGHEILPQHAGSRVKIFIDGEECSSYSYGGSFNSVNSRGQYKIGYADTMYTAADYEYLAAEYDEFCVWNRAFNSTEIKSLNYYRGQGKKCKDFVYKSEFRIYDYDSGLMVDYYNTTVNVFNESVNETYTGLGIVRVNESKMDKGLYNITIINPYYYTLKLYNFNFSQNNSIIKVYLDPKKKPKIIVKDYDLKELDIKTYDINLTYNNEIYNLKNYSFKNNTINYVLVSEIPIVNGDNTTVIVEVNTSYDRILSKEFLDTFNISVDFEDLVVNNTINKNAITNISLKYKYTTYNFNVNPLESIYNMYTNLSYNYYNDGKVNIGCYYNKSTDDTLVSGTKNVYSKECFFNNNIITSQNINQNIKLYPVLKIEYDNNTYYRTNNSYKTQTNKVFNIIVDLGTSNPPTGYYEALRINLYDEDIYPGLTYNYSQYFNPWNFKVLGTKGVYKTISYNNNKNTKTPIYRLLVTPTYIKLKNNRTLNFEYNSYYNVNDKTYTRFYWIENNCMEIDNSSSKIVSVYPIGTETYGYPNNLINVNINVKDNAGNPIRDAIVKVMRQKNDGSFYLDEKTKTNENGEASAKIIAYDEIYYFIVQKDCKEIYKTTTTNIISNTITINVQDTGGVVYDSIINDLDYSLVYDNITETENLNYSSVGGIKGPVCLKILVSSYPYEKEYNSSCLNTETGQITLPKPEDYGKYTVIVEYDGQIISKEIRDFGSFNPTFKGTGLILYFIFTLIILGVSINYVNPYIFLVLHPVLTLVSGIIGMINITYNTSITYIILSLAFLYFLKRRGGYY